MASTASQPQALAVSRLEPQASEGDYTALSTALEASARGRAFLAEYARRHRNADTERVLAAIERLEAQMRADAAGVQHMRAELRTLLVAIRLARPDIDAGRAPDKVAMLSELIDLLERRLHGLVDNKAAEAPPPAEPPRPQLAVVPPPEQPELPIPSPASERPAIAVAAPAEPRRMTLIPEVNVVEPAPPAPAASAPAAAAKTPAPSAPTMQPSSMAKFELAQSGLPTPEWVGGEPLEFEPLELQRAKVESVRVDAARPEPAANRQRILAPIMALSEDERLALFT